MHPIAQNRTAHCGRGFLLVSSLYSLCLCGESSAALDPEIDKPYQLTVVVQVAQRPPLTAAFGDRVRHELRDSLRAAIGDLGRVEVTDQHPLLKDALTKGLEPTLQAWKEVSDQKTHFVLIDFVDGQYEIQAGQHDGLTGLSSPVRRARTPDRQIGARLAALLIDQDFGMVGTIDPNIKGEEVKVTVKAAALGAPLDHWIAKDDVFAVAQIKKAGKDTRSYRVDWALLKVIEEPKVGVCRCQLFHRRKNPLEAGSGVLGYRCLKLGTTAAPLRLRLVNEKDRSPLAGRAVTISANDFDQKPKEEHSTQADGTIFTKESYHHIAFVRVLDANGDVQAKIPVEILDDRLVVCSLGINRQAEELGDLEFKRKRWLNRVYESRLAVGVLFQELNRAAEKSPQSFLEKAQTALKSMETDQANLTEELGELKKTAKAATQGKAILADLAEGERRLQELRAKREELAAIATGLEKDLQLAQSPKAKDLRTMVQQAKLLESEADFDEAIEMYEKILRVGGEQPSVKAHLQKLQEEWAPKNNQHRDARKMIYWVWPKVVSATEMKAHLKEARNAFQICQRAGDHLTPVRLLIANIAHLAKLEKELEGLQGEASGENRAKAQTISEVAEELKKLIEEVSSYLAAAKK